MQARLWSIGLLALAMAAVAADAAAQTGRRARGDWRADQDAEGRQMRFRNMDADRDGVITRAEWRGSLQAFQREDTNDDNVLSGPELWTERSAGDSNDLTRIFDRADRNNDRLLSRDEWYGDLPTFERIDRNDDGRISLAEFLGEEAEEAREDEQTPAYRAGYARGLQEGRQAGREDKSVNGGVWDLDGQRELEQADSGYTPSLGPRHEYQAGYRAGFRRGYREGFGVRGLVP